LNCFIVADVALVDRATAEPACDADLVGGAGSAEAVNFVEAVDFAEAVDVAEAADITDFVKAGVGDDTPDLEEIFDVPVCAEAPILTNKPSATQGSAIFFIKLLIYNNV